MVLSATVSASATEPATEPAAETNSESTAEPDALFIAGVAGIALGAASAVMFGIAASRVTQIQDEPGYMRYREGFDSSVSVCDAADESLVSAVAGSAPPLLVRDYCSEASTWEVVSFISLPLAVAAMGAGAIMLFQSDALSLTAHGSGMSLSGRF